MRSLWVVESGGSAAVVYDSVPRIGWLASLDPVGGVVDQCLESLHLDEHNLTRRMNRGQDRLENACVLRSAAGGRRREGVTLALVTLDDGATPDYLTSIRETLPTDWFLFAFTRAAIGARDDLLLRHVPAATEHEFTLKVARHIEKLVQAQPPMSRLVPATVDFPTDHHLVEGLHAYSPAVGKRHTLRISRRGVHYDLFSDLRHASRHLVVLGQDALNRARVTLPHFFRWSWLVDLEASALVLNDPTLYLDSRLNAGWWVGTQDRDYAAELTEIVSVAASHLGLSSRDVLFVGASAGGFSAFHMASCLPGSRALVDIPQVNLRTYAQRHESDAAIKAGLGFDDADAVPADYQHRIDVIDRFVQQRSVPDFVYLQNELDATHVDAQYGQFVSRLDGLAKNHSWARSTVSFETYRAWHLVKGGHFPLSRQALLRRVNSYLRS